MYKTTAHHLTAQAANLTRRLAYARDRLKRYDTDDANRADRAARRAADRYARRDRNARHTERLLASEAIRTRDSIRDELSVFDGISDYMYTERRERLAYALSRAEYRVSRRRTGGTQAPRRQTHPLTPTAC